MEEDNREACLIQAMDRYGRFILWYLNGLCRDGGIAEDLSQKLWVYVFQKFETKDFEHAGFLKRKARQLYIDEMRRLDSRPDITFMDEMPAPQERPVTGEPLDSRQEQGLFSDFWSRFDSLSFSDDQKLIFWLHARYGFTMKEVGERVGMASSTAYDQLKQVKEACLNHLNTNSDKV